MLADCFENLQHSIRWAMFDLDIDVLQFAQQQLQQAEARIVSLPRTEQQQAWQQLDALLPMEWPLWMELCREQVTAEQPRVLH